jgi:hypothetical protein
MHFPARINAHAALSTENMLRNGSLGNGGAIDYNLSVFPLFDVLAPAIPVFVLAVSWSLSFFFDLGRALWDATAVELVLVTMVLKHESLVQ